VTGGRSRALVLAATVLLGVLAGCSSDGSDGSETTIRSIEVTTTTVVATATVPPSFDPTTATAAAYADALDDGLSEGDASLGQIVVTGEQAVCIAPLQVAAIGVQTLVDQEVPPVILADPAYRYDELGLDNTQAGAMLDAYATCGADVFGLFAVALTPDQDEAIQACAVASLDRDLARTALIAALTGSLELEADLTAVVQQVVSICQPTGG